MSPYDNEKKKKLFGTIKRWKTEAAPQRKKLYDEPYKRMDGRKLWALTVIGVMGVVLLTAVIFRLSKK
jgi:hypothetical protein